MNAVAFSEPTMRTLPDGSKLLVDEQVAIPETVTSWSFEGSPLPSVIVTHLPYCNSKVKRRATFAPGVYPWRDTSLLLV